MSIKLVNPYIHFNGSAENAIRLYDSALGAKVEHIMRYADVPGMCAQQPENKNLIMHGALRVEGGMIMVSDAPPDKPVETGGNVQVALHYVELAAMEKAFAALSTGGKVTVPLQHMFWGAKFGMLTDACGVRWMFNCELKKA